MPVTLLMKYLKKILNNDFYIQPFEDREGRAKFLSKIFGKYLKISILDVGCGDRFLKKYLSNDIKYVGVDINKNADVVINLEEDRLTKFDDRSFYNIICTDVLEHLENIHEIFDDLCRISQKYIIISLPNCWTKFSLSLITGIVDNKYYGLPVEKPLDRHKWFFNYNDALKFLKERGKINGFFIKYSFTTPFILNTIKHQLFMMMRDLT